MPSKVLCLLFFELLGGDPVQVFDTFWSLFSSVHLKSKQLFVGISEPSMPSTVSRTKSVAVTPKRTPLAPHNANTTGHDAYRWSFLRSLAGDTPNIRRHPDSMRF